MQVATPSHVLLEGCLRPILFWELASSSHGVLSTIPAMTVDVGRKKSHTCHKRVHAVCSLSQELLTGLPGEWHQEGPMRGIGGWVLKVLPLKIK
jgi:hypothetical protein